MPYVKTINEDGVVSDIMAKALDPDALVNGFTQETAGEKALDAAAGKTLNDSLSTLDGAVVKKSNLVNGFTQTTPGANALDAAAGKSLNDSLSNCVTKTELANGYVPQTSSVTIPSWKGIFNFYSGSSAITMIIPVASLKDGTLSSSSNISWNLFGITYTNPAGVSIASNVSLTVSSVERITRDLAAVTFAKPSTMTTDMYGVAVNRGQFKISST